MSPIGTKEEFRAPSHILEKERERLGIKTPHTPIVVSAENLVGTWVNISHDTRDLVRLMVSLKGNEIVVHAFGACHPNPCDWGQAPARMYAENVASAPATSLIANYKFDFAEVAVTARLLKGALFVESFTHFTDQSGRADYYALDIMSK
ncbi:MAG TPA: hypothetical protein VL967_10045 [Terracidiphilus sp.]|nr:hypothetical protein [Terracidiphilus sp.]